jgi:hypothetical protein
MGFFGLCAVLISSALLWVFYCELVGRPLGGDRQRPGLLALAWWSCGAFLAWAAFVGFGRELLLVWVR